MFIRVFPEKSKIEFKSRQQEEITVGKRINNKSKTIKFMISDILNAMLLCNKNVVLMSVLFVAVLNYRLSKITKIQIRLEY